MHFMIQCWSLLHISNTLNNSDSQLLGYMWSKCNASNCLYWQINSTVFPQCTFHISARLLDHEKPNGAILASTCFVILLGAFTKLPWVDPALLTRVSPWQELTEQSHSPSCGDGMHLRSPPSDPLHKQGTGGWPGWAPSKLFERTGADRGRPREAKRMHPLITFGHCLHWTTVASEELLAKMASSAVSHLSRSSRTRHSI